MKNILLAGIILLAFSSCKPQAETYEISGKVTDFNGTPLDSVSIRLMNKAFETVYETLSDKNGNYTMKVEKGHYNCLYAIKKSDYRVTKLEYWAWNVPVTQNLTINPQYDKMEIYGINVFEPQVTPHETYMIYFRPMSLMKGFQLVAKQKIDEKAFQKAKRTESLLDTTNKLVDISPDTITPKELIIEVNGIKATIVEIHKVKEYARGFEMYGYCVQIIKPKNKDKETGEYDKISITLHSQATDEMGKGEVFFKKRTD